MCTTAYHHHLIKPVFSSRGCFERDSGQVSSLPVIALKDRGLVAWHKTNVRIGQWAGELEWQMHIPLTTVEKVNMWKWPQEKSKNDHTGQQHQVWDNCNQLVLVNFPSCECGAMGAWCKCEIVKGSCSEVYKLATIAKPYHYSSNSQRVVSQKQYAEPFGK